VTIRPLTPADAAAWFDACAEAVRTQPGWVAADEAGVVEGFLTRDFYRRAGLRDVHEYRPAGWGQSALLLVRPLG